MPLAHILLARQVFFDKGELGARLRGRTITHVSKKGCEKGILRRALRRFSEGFLKGVFFLGGFKGKGSQKSSQKGEGFSEGASASQRDEAGPDNISKEPAAKLCKE